MAVVSVDAAQCYDRVNHMIMAFFWHALIGKMGPILVLLHCMQNMILFQRTGLGDSITFLDGGKLSKYIMGLGQGSRGAPPSWIQLSSAIVNVLQGLDYGAMIADPITGDVVHPVGSTFADNTDLYCWEESL